MENASKALLIAAVVLIVILIVTMGLRILDSTDDVSEATDEASESIALGNAENSEELLHLIENNLVRIKDHTVEVNDYWFEDYNFNKDPKSKVLLKPNTTYKLSFDYKVNESDEKVAIGCGIGFGENAYNVDILDNKYPNQVQGTYIKEITTPDKFMYVKADGAIVEVTKPYLQIRFARMQEKSSCSVDISNVKFVKVK